MKLSRQIRKKLSVCLSTALIVNTCSALSFRAAGRDGIGEAGPSAIISGAAAYLGTKVNADKSIGDNRLVNETAYALAALRTAGASGYEDSIKWLSEQADSENTDISARIASALGSSEYLEKMETKQNKDNGFGLYPDYSSDVIDSVLVLDAINETGYSGDDISGANLAMYLLKAANEDGGFAYAESNKSDPLLTAVAVYDIGVFFADHHYDVSQFSKSVTYVAENITDSYEDADIQKTICKHLALKSMGLETDLSDVVQGLQAAQKADGSFAEDITATYWAVKLLAGESSQPSQETTTTTTTTTTTSTDTTTTTTTTTSTTSSKTSTTSKTTSTSTKTSTTTSKTTSTSTKTSTTTSKTTSTSTKTSTTTSKTTSTTSKTTTSTTTSVPVTTSTTTAYTGHKAVLNWDDLSVEGADVSYQVFRRVNGEAWESYSVWDGKEKIDVLNVYPTDPYLENWMTEPLESEDTPAGKDLMNIDSVYFGDFNSEPEKYMYDEDGNWKYDVIFFGAADGNDGFDLSADSYAVTRKFTDSGRGVLFGHDTICAATASWCQDREYFNKFAEDLGFVLSMTYPGDWTGISSASVVKEGIMTAFPWEISGELEIPETHSTGQHNISATEWILLNTERREESETGALDGMYLSTKNNLGLIQTGNSNGQAADDERKVLANTLFYLYQNTNNTTTVDNAFYDIDAPVKVHLLDASVSDGKMGISIQAEDEGTVYEYYAKARLGNNSIKSNIQKHVALSGMAGFIVKVTDSEESAFSLLEYEEDGLTAKDIIPADADGKAMLSAVLKEGAEPQFLHIFAVDKANNISEITAPVPENAGEKIRLGDVNFDGKVNAVDASMILAEYARTSSNKAAEFSEKQFIAGDVDENSAINAVDASKVLAYYAYTSTGGELDDMRDWMALTAKSPEKKQ